MLRVRAWLWRRTRRRSRAARTTQEKLKSALDGDLDGIALKALAKNPEERYAAAAQLADDIRAIWMASR